MIRPGAAPARADNVGPHSMFTFSFRSSGMSLSSADKLVIRSRISVAVLLEPVGQDEPSRVVERLVLAGADQAQQRAVHGRIPGAERVSSRKSWRPLSPSTRRRAITRP